MIKIEKKIFMIDEDNRDLWFIDKIESLTDYEEDKYITIYKSNKILNDITETLNHLLEIGKVS